MNNTQLKLLNKVLYCLADTAMELTDNESVYDDNGDSVSWDDIKEAQKAVRKALEASEPCLGSVEFVYNEEDGYELPLTFNKFYEIVDETPFLYYVKDDSGSLEWFAKSWFNEKVPF